MNKRIFNKIISSPVKPGNPASNREKGFTFPVAMATGLLIVGIAMAASMNAKSGELDAESKKQNQQAMAVAEGGSARTMKNLNDSKYARWLKGNYQNGQWTFLDSNSNTYCDNSVTPKVAITSGYIGDNEKKNIFKLHEYKYNDQGTDDPLDDTGTFTVDAQRKKNNEQAGGARVKITVKLYNPDEPRSREDTFPGLYAKTYIDIGNGNVKDDADLFTVDGVNNANVLCENCEIPASTINNYYCEPDSAAAQEAAKDAICKGSCPKSEVDGKIYVGPVDLPPVLTPPANEANKNVQTSLLTTPCTDSSKCSN